MDWPRHHMQPHAEARAAPEPEVCGRLNSDLCAGQRSLLSSEEVDMAAESFDPFGLHPLSLYRANATQGHDNSNNRDLRSRDVGATTSGMTSGEIKSSSEESDPGAMSPERITSVNASFSGDIYSIDRSNERTNITLRRHIDRREEHKSRGEASQHVPAHPDGRAEPSPTITKGKLSGMTLASALARRRDICDGAHSSQADCSSYNYFLQNYQSALTRSKQRKSITSESQRRFRDQQKRAAALKGHVRRQREAIDSKAKGINIELSRRTSTDLKGCPCSPDVHSASSSWSGTDFGESDSVLFSPGETPSIASDHGVEPQDDMFFFAPDQDWVRTRSQPSTRSNADVCSSQLDIETIYEHSSEESEQDERELSTEGERYPTEAANGIRRTTSASTGCSCSDLYIDEDGNNDDRMDVPRQIILMSQEGDVYRAPIAQRCSDSSRPDTNEQAKSSSCDGSNGTNPKPRRDGRGGEQAAASVSQPDQCDAAMLMLRRSDLTNTSKPTLYAEMRAKLRKVHDGDRVDPSRPQNNSEKRPPHCEQESMKNLGGETEYPIQHARAMKLQETQDKTQSPRTAPDNPSSPASESSQLPDQREHNTGQLSFATFKSDACPAPSFECTEVTAPESFELSETGNSICEDARDSTSSQRATGVAARGNMLSALFLAKSASCSAQRASLDLNSVAGRDDSPRSESTAKADHNVGSEGMLVAAETDNESSPNRSSASANAALINANFAHAKYFKMIKYGMPREAVDHAMKRDGVDPSVLDGVITGPTGGSRCALKDDKKYDKYFRMLKVGLQMDVVKHAMERDGLDPTVMDGNHNAPADAKITVGVLKQKDTHRRTRLHWDTLHDVRSNSVWALVNEDPDVEINIDEDEFAQLFQTELPSGETKLQNRAIGDSGNENSAVKVIDPKRANNGGIILARLKMSYEEMTSLARDIDEMSAICKDESAHYELEQLQSIAPYLPTSEEKELLRTYLGSGTAFSQKFGGLCELEKFMVALMDVRHPEEKLRALLFQAQFASLATELRNDALLVDQACDELNNSARFRKLLGIVLNVGNRLNTAGKRKDKAAAGIKITSLLKLNQVKAFDKKTSLMHYIITVIMRNNEEVISFKDDLQTVLRAKSVYWAQVYEQLTALETQVKATRSVALQQALQRRSNSDIVLEEKPPMDKHLAEDEDILRSTRVGAFVLGAFREVSALRDNIDATTKKFEDVKSFFGVETTMQPDELFNIIATFSNDIDQARRQIVETKKSKKIKLPWIRKKQET